MAQLIPDVNVNIQDGGLGLLSPGAENVDLKIGVSSLGVTNQLYAFTDSEDVRTTLGAGPLASEVAASVGSGLTYAIRAAASVAGVLGTVTVGGSNTGDGTVAVTGTPLDGYDAIVEITRDGSAAGNDAAFKYSLDGGDTYSGELALTASYVITDTGLTLTFTDGTGTPTFVTGDVYTFEATAPAMNLTDLNAAIDAAFADPREWEFIDVVGASSPVIAAGVAVRMEEAKAAHRFVFALLRARDVDDTTDSGSLDTWRSNLITEWASFGNYRVGAAAGYAELPDVLTGRVNRRSIGGPYASRLKSIGVSTHPGRVIDGPVAGVVSLSHDEQAKTGLDAEGFTTFRSIIGRRGFYVTRGRQMAPQGSDFQSVQMLRAMNKACRISRDATLRFLNDDVRVDATTGFILEADARAIEAYVGGILNAAMVSAGEVSAASVTVKRNVNILSTQSMTIKVSIVPLAYLENISIDIGFENPALQPV